ncbi:MAG: PIN domain-containing protein [Methanospirillum sp.]|uniref:type II toxin-antitoxin system VapC family toxin n=1 Tax=Methanospirillum sp. TaxID=45200 RepID=UPI0023753712|nr:PIN domain-containing protein [Methanospirillum sp.]MDD1729838.1 PIN domain-containing protein [Methanospirillum sp.]
MGIIDNIKGEQIYLDTNIFIYALEAFPEYVNTLTSLFTALDEGNLKAVTSELTLAELLIKPLITKNDHLQHVYQETIQSSDNLEVIPISRQIFIDAAKIRAQSTTIHLPDAIHLASAKACYCSSFVTNDKRLKGISDINMLILSDIH